MHRELLDWLQAMLAEGRDAGVFRFKGDPAANDAAIGKVKADKLREVKAGHDGTWVAHPGLVAVAKEIFDFCAAQSCHLSGPPAISHCIPFQYVIDGCYARAHKMRQVIEEKYGYCSEKVFSFANLGGDTLAVKANMWGGCCVFWWYHVAPLVRVRIKINLLPSSFQFVLAMVIDPSMFTKPVLLSTWLAAQASKTCAEHAKVSMYSIQPSSAYTPANYQGTAFSTDSDYSKTHGTLVSYKNLTTC